MEAVLRDKFIAVNAYIKKEERSQMSNLTLYLTELEKRSKGNKASRWKEIIRIRAVFNKMRTE